MGTTREQADLMALRYLRDSGPDTPGQINDDETLAAWMIYADLEKRGYVRSTNFGNGNVQFSITEAGRSFAEATNA